MPQSPYAASKAAAHVLCDAYRRAFDLRVSCGTLSNHELRIGDRPRFSRPRSSAMSGRFPGLTIASGRHLSHCASATSRSAGSGGSRPTMSMGSSACTARSRSALTSRGSGSKRTRIELPGLHPRVRVARHAVWELIDRAFELRGSRSNGTARRLIRGTGPPAWRRPGRSRSSWNQPSSAAPIRRPSGRTRPGRNTNSDGVPVPNSTHSSST